jgi:hypothetical protein
MARIPKSQIISNLQAKTSEFVYVDSGLPFSGSYHIINGKIYAGANEKTYQQPIPIEKPANNNLSNIINSTGLGSAAHNLSLRNKETTRNLAPKQINPHIIRINSPLKIGINYYFQKSNDPNYIIKKISHDEAIQLARDPINKVISIDFSAENLNTQLESAEKIIPGITAFVNL